MATTGFWPVKGSLRAVVEYANNPDKTTDSRYLDDDLARTLEYAANDSKTDRKMYVSGINCAKSHAYEDMLAVQRRFGLRGSNVAYHGYQSFKEDEVTPPQAHEIGVQMAKELWGDRFQVVIATHVNTRCTHNHFVINSVSFKDGGRYHDCTATYRLMREVSDRICLEHGLSIIEEPKGRGVSQYLYKMEKAGMMTRYNVARQAIDEAVALSVTMEEFQTEMKNRGYLLKFEPRLKYWSIVPPGWKKPIRIHKLGEDYTRERIQERISDNDISVRTVRLRQQYRIPNNYSLKRRVDRIMGRSGLEKLYLRYCYELGYLPKYRQNPTRLHIVLKEDLLKCDQYSEQAKLLSRYHISTEEDLSSHQGKVKEKMADITARRDELRKKARRMLPEAEVTKTKEEIKQLTTELRQLRREVKVCEQIRERSGHVKENLDIVDSDRQKEKEKSR